MDITITQDDNNITVKGSDTRFIFMDGKISGDEIVLSNKKATVEEIKTDIEFWKAVLK